MDDRLLRMMPAARSERGLALVNCPPGGPVAQRLVQGTHNPFDQTGLRKKGCGHMELERK